MQPSSIMQVLKRLARLLTGSKPSSAADTMTNTRGDVPLVIRPPLAPAVAGFLQRTPARKPNFHLAARLASVARLNTPSGRKPSQISARTKLAAPRPADRSANAIKSPAIQQPIRNRVIKPVSAATNVVVLSEHIAQRANQRLTLAQRIVRAA